MTSQGPDDIITVSLSEEAHGHLTRLKEDGVFPEMRDAYKCGFALAITRGLVAPIEEKRSRTYLNVGSLDPDGVLRGVVMELFPEARSRPYAFVERLAEAGVSELGRLHASGELRFSDILERQPT